MNNTIWRKKHHFVFINLSLKYSIREMCKTILIERLRLPCKMGKVKETVRMEVWEYLVKRVRSIQLNYINKHNPIKCLQPRSNRVEKVQLKSKRFSFANVNITTHLVVRIEKSMNVCTLKHPHFGLRMKLNRLDQWIIHKKKFHGEIN